ncbi:MAG: radical SAM protein [Phycisphaerae bacterium]|jgi:7-carboxy-7-deazaguanine synthase
MAETERLQVNEIFHSVQGEGTRVGARCVFVRLTGCHLRCSYCDTQYAFQGGDMLTTAEILERVRAYGCPTVEVTGGEPLLQQPVHPLLRQLADEYATVLLETCGAVSIADVDPRVVRIVDIKCPGSSQSDRNEWSNMELLTARDEVKFVVLNRTDYNWAKDVIARYDLLARCPVLIAPVFGVLEPVDLTSWILEDRLDVRLGLQLHKVIWPATKMGV